MGNLKLYNEHFERGFLSETEVFYARESERWLHTDSLQEYLIKARPPAIPPSCAPVSAL
jgi:hypothetical protein